MINVTLRKVCFQNHEIITSKAITKHIKTHVSFMTKVFDCIRNQWVCIWSCQHVFCKKHHCLKIQIELSRWSIVYCPRRLNYSSEWTCSEDALLKTHNILNGQARDCYRKENIVLLGGRYLNITSFLNFSQAKPRLVSWWHQALSSLHIIWRT